MSSSNNLATIEPWMFPSTINESFYPDSFARDTESALTKALQQSFFTNQQQQQQSQYTNPISSTYPILNQTNSYNYSNFNTTTTTSASISTITASVSGSGSEPETPGSIHRGCLKSILGVSNKPPKRKSRVTKRSTTMFIQADAANFRQMVQQVTGVKVEGLNGQYPVSTVVKPEPLRQPYANKLQGLLPTLDTSSDYFVNRQGVSGNMSQLQGVNQLMENGGGGVDFYSYPSFPTLESSF